jgi:hypothetical protein
MDAPLIPSDAINNLSPTSLLVRLVRSQVGEKTKDGKGIKLQNCLVAEKKFFKNIHRRTKSNSFSDGLGCASARKLKLGPNICTRPTKI